jgi:hypothetical protein
LQRKNKALQVHHQLTDVRTWIQIEKNKRPIPTLDKNIQEIREKLKVPNQFAESSLREEVDKELDEYILNHSIIHKELAVIDKRMHEIERAAKAALNPFGIDTNHDYFRLLTRLENLLMKLEGVRKTVNPFSPSTALDSLIAIIKQKIAELIKKMDEKNNSSASTNTRTNTAAPV